MSESLGDWMKTYEAVEAGRRLDPSLPTLARIDGRKFSSFTRGMERPFDARMSAVMIDTANYLVRETNAMMGYTQSDEITLVWLSTNPQSQIYFGGRTTKLVSQLAAQATLAFYRLIEKRMPEFADRLPTFDARVWQVPDLTEAANVFLWRENDAIKNSINMAARTVFSERDLHGKNGAIKRKMLLEKGVDWDAYPTFFKRGTYIQRRSVMRPFSAQEISRLPEKHAARSNPDLQVARIDWMPVEMPPSVWLLTGRMSSSPVRSRYPN